MNIFKRLKNNIALKRYIKEAKALQAETKKDYHIISFHQELVIIDNRGHYVLNKLSTRKSIIHYQAIINLSIWSTVAGFNKNYSHMFYKMK